MATRHVNVKLVNPELLHPHPRNIRKRMGDIAGIAGSIADIGQLEALVIQAHPDRPGHYLILAGERRWRAAIEAGEKGLLCVVREPQTRRGTLVIMFGENGHREDLTPMEYAWGFRDLRDGDPDEREGPMSPQQIAAATGFKVEFVRRHLMLLELADATQQRVHERDLSMAEALEALRGTHAGQRRARGHRPPGAKARKPDHFTRRHRLAAAVKARCADAGHTGVYKYGRTGCGPCWEAEIAADAVRGSQPASSGQDGEPAPGRRILTVVAPAAAGVAG